MTKQEFIDKYAGDVMMRGVMERDLREVIQTAIAEHEQAKWKKYPENKPKEKGRYQITTKNHDVGSALWKDNKWWMDDDEDVFIMGLKDEFIIAFCELPKPFKNECNGTKN